MGDKVACEFDVQFVCADVQSDKVKYVAIAFQRGDNKGEIPKVKKDGADGLYSWDDVSKSFQVSMQRDESSKKFKSKSLTLHLLRVGSSGNTLLGTGKVDLADFVNARAKSTTVQVKKGTMTLRISGTVRKDVESDAESSASAASMEDTSFDDVDEETIADAEAFELEADTTQEAQKQLAKLGSRSESSAAHKSSAGSKKAYPEPNFSQGRVKFQVIAHILEARELVGKDGNGMSDPMVQVTVVDKKSETSTKKNTVNCTFDEILFFDSKLGPDSFRGGKINIQVFDANSVMRNELIGAFEFGISDVYFREGHEVHKQWVALVDTTLKNEGIQGYLKLSVRVLGPGDIATTHGESDDEMDNDEDADLSSMVLMPPDISTETKVLEVKVGRGAGLPKMDRIGTVDPYVKVKFGGVKGKTKYIKNSQNPTWMQSVEIPVTLPALSDTIDISLYDHDTADSDDLIATHFLSLSDVMERGGLPPRWVNFYCVPFNVSKQLREIAEPTFFAGRVNIEVDWKDPVEGEKLVAAEKYCGSVPEPKVERWWVHVDVWEANELSSGDKSFVEIEMATSKSKTDVRSNKKHTVRWFSNLPELELELSTDVQSNPDLFINVMTSTLTSSNRVGFLRIPFEELVSSSEIKPGWKTLRPDMASKAYTSEQVPGFILYRAQAGKMSSGPPPKRYNVAQPALSVYELRAYLFSARGLPAGDKSGMNDPYVVCNCAGMKSKSQTKRQTNDPDFFECLVMSVSLPDELNLAPDVQLVVWDWDRIGSNDQIGRISLKTPQLLLNNAEKPKPTLYDLFLDDPNQSTGSLLACVQLLPENAASLDPPTDIQPKMKKCSLQVSLVGARSLLPKSTFGLNAPWVELDGGSRSDKALIVKTKASSKPSAVNPNFQELLNLSLKIPEDPLFAPRANLTVMDTKGLSKVVVGVVSVPLAPLLPWLSSQQRAEINRDIQIADGMYIPGSTTRQELAGDVKEDLSMAAVKGANSDDVAINIANHSDSDPDDDDVEQPLLKKSKSKKKKSASMKRRQRVPKNGDGSSAPEDEEVELAGAGASEDLQFEAANIDDPVMSRPAERVELERIIQGTAFDELQLFRGKVRGLSKKEKKQREKALLEFNARKPAGKLKACVQLTENKTGQSAGRVIPVKDLASQKVIVRLYVIRGIQVVPKDSGGTSDPFIQIAYGPGKKTIIKDKNSMREQTLNPEFYCVYEMELNLPGDSEIDIQVWDWDKVGSNDLIGTTTIDVENRWFNDEWKGYAKKPLEIRSLWSPKSRLPQGRIELWMDVMSMSEASMTPKIDIQPPVPEPYEMRIIIWNTRNVVFKDGDSSDIYVVAFMEDDKKNKQETDVHWNSDDGTGMFNWRMKFKLDLPYKLPRMKLQIWDKDTVTSDDSIGEAAISLQKLFQRAYVQKKSQALEAQWVALYHPNFEGIQGEVEMSLEVLTAAEAAARPNGKGQEEPNAFPKLDPPDRPETSFGPFALGKRLKLFGKKMMKVMIGLGILAVIGGGIALYFYIQYGPAAFVKGGGSGGKEGGGGGKQK